MQKRANRNDVARRAGVSSATVSRAYNLPDSVSPEKRERILTAAAELGYEPNPHARSLRRRSSGTITLVEFPKKGRPYYWGEEPLMKWMYADVVRAALEEAGQGLFQLRLATLATPEEAKILGRNSEGILAYDVDTAAEAALIRGLSCPGVICHHVEGFPAPDRVSTDNRQGGRLQAQYLKESGCRRPLYLTHHLDLVESHKLRLEGFLELYSRDEVVVLDSTENASVVQPTWEDLARQGVDGAAGVNDLTLLNQLSASWRRGLLPPARWPLVGYDNLPVLRFFPAAIASVDLQLARIYAAATERLIHRIRTGEPPGAPPVIPPLLVPPAK